MMNDIGHMDIMPNEYEISEQNDLIQQIENVKNYIIMLEDKIVDMNEEIERYKRKEKMRGGKNVK